MKIYQDARFEGADSAGPRADPSTEVLAIGYMKGEMDAMGIQYRA